MVNFEMKDQFHIIQASSGISEIVTSQDVTLFDYRILLSHRFLIVHKKKIYFEVMPLR